MIFSVSRSTRSRNVRVAPSPAHSFSILVVIWRMSWALVAKSSSGRRQSGARLVLEAGLKPPSHFAVQTSSLALGLGLELGAQALANPQFWLDNMGRLRGN